jgi:hypothetical protein
MQWRAFIFNGFEIVCVLQLEGLGSSKSEQLWKIIQETFYTNEF